MFHLAILEDNLPMAVLSHGPWASSIDPNQYFCIDIDIDVNIDKNQYFYIDTNIDMHIDVSIDAILI
jgi:hypothetical protein